MEHLVPIGRFSKMTRLSVKALRLYGELGLLDPAWIDPSSGYRYYRFGQANRAEAIRILRRVDMPLDDIAAVLATDEPDIVTKQLAMHRDRLAERLADDERMLRFIERLIERKERIMPYDVNLKDVADQTVATVRKHTDLASIGTDLEAGFGAIMAQVGAAGASVAGAPFVTYHAVIDEETAGDIDISVPVADSPELDGDGEVDIVELPAHLVASTVHRGPYDELSPAYHTLTGWIQEHGHQMAGAPREIYLNDPASVSPDELLTEVQWPIERD